MKPRFPQRENPHAFEARGLHSTEHVQVTMITLKPGEGLKLHLIPVDAFFCVLQGTGKVETEGEVEEVGVDIPQQGDATRLLRRAPRRR